MLGMMATLIMNIGYVRSSKGLIGSIHLALPESPAIIGRAAIPAMIMLTVLAQPMMPMRIGVAPPAGPRPQARPSPRVVLVVPAGTPTLTLALMLVLVSSLPRRGPCGVPPPPTHFNAAIARTPSIFLGNDGILTSRYLVALPAAPDETRAEVAAAWLMLRILVPMNDLDVAAELRSSALQTRVKSVPSTSFRGSVGQPGNISLTWRCHCPTAEADPGLRRPRLLQGWSKLPSVECLNLLLLRQFEGTPACLGPLLAGRPSKDRLTITLIVLPPSERAPLVEERRPRVPPRPSASSCCAIASGVALLRLVDAPIPRPLTRRPMPPRARWPGTPRPPTPRQALALSAARRLDF